MAGAAHSCHTQKGALLVRQCSATPFKRTLGDKGSPTARLKLASFTRIKHLVQLVGTEPPHVTWSCNFRDRMRSYGYRPWVPRRSKGVPWSSTHFPRCLPMPRIGTPMFPLPTFNRLDLAEDMSSAFVVYRNVRAPVKLSPSSRRSCAEAANLCQAVAPSFEESVS